jgi:hypothetical protein
VQHRSIRIALASLAAALTVVATAAAVTGSTPDGDAHPYVGALFVDGTIACSAVLVAPSVVVTAGHCGVDGARVGVTFDADLDDGWSLRAGTLEIDPSKGSDLAVVVLDAPARVAPAALPVAGAAAGVAKGSSLTSVGYGYSSPGVYDGLRRVADSPVVKVGKATITLSTADGGPCMGDSGGPQLAGDTVVSVTSTGSKDCTGKAEGYRLDTMSARAFLGSFLALP